LLIFNSVTFQITGVHFNTSHFTIDYHDRHFVLDLFLNHHLLSNSFSIATFDKDGKRQLHKPLPHVSNAMIRSLI